MKSTTQLLSLIVTTFVAFFIMTASAKEKAQTSQTTSALEVIDTQAIVDGQRYFLKSKILNETRIIDVSLPEQYHASSYKKTYPVILVLDGQFMFDSVTGVVRHLSSVDRMPESIIIGMPNPKGKRSHYSPNLYINGSLNWGEEGKVDFGDKPEHLIEFFKQELFPFIHSTFRAANFKTLVGLSPTSAFTLHTVWKAPELFQAHIAIAAGDVLRLAYEPNKSIAKTIHNFYRENPNNKSYLYVSSADGDLVDDANIKKYLDDFSTSLLALNNKNLRVKAELINNETHYGVVMRSILAAMETFYPVEKWSVDYMTLARKSGNALDNIEKHYQNLSNDYGFTITPKVNRFHNINSLNWIGHRLIRDGRIAEAIEVFQRWQDLYPNDPLAHKSLSEALEADGKNKAAYTAQQEAFKIASQTNDTELSYFAKRLTALKAKL